MNTSAKVVIGGFVLSIVVALLYFDPQGYTVNNLTVTGTSKLNEGYEATFEVKFKGEPPEPVITELLKSMQAELTPTEFSHITNAPQAIERESADVVDKFNEVSTTPIKEIKLLKVVRDDIKG